MDSQNNKNEDDPIITEEQDGEVKQYPPKRKIKIKTITNEVYELEVYSNVTNN